MYENTKSILKDQFFLIPKNYLKEEVSRVYFFPEQQRT